MYNKFGNILWSDNKLLLSCLLFQDMNKYNITFESLNVFLEGYIQLRNSFFVDSPMNQEIYLHKNKEYFTFGIYDGTFNLWHNHSDFLGDMKINVKAKPSEEFCRWIQAKIDNYLSGSINCSDCGKLITKNEIAGRYFAGQYCDKCWNGKWKAIEAKENYD